MTSKRLEALADRVEIQDVLARYARGIDRADLDILESCYFPDAIEEHGSVYTGNAYAYFKIAVERLQTRGVMNHFLCSSHVDFDGPDRAWVETYALTFMRVNKGGKDYDTLTGGRYCDRFERRDGEWRIAHRKICLDWNRDMDSNEGWCFGVFDMTHPAIHRGTKNKTDLSYSHF